MDGLRLSLDAPPELVEAIAERAAEIVLERLQVERPGPESRFLSIDEAAAYLRCNRQRIYDLRSSGRLSRNADGSRALVERAELEALVDADAQRLPTSLGSGNGSGVRR